MNSLSVKAKYQIGQFESLKQIFCKFVGQSDLQTIFPIFLVTSAYKAISLVTSNYKTENVVTSGYKAVKLATSGYNRQAVFIG